MNKKYIFHSSCFEKELLRKQLTILNDNLIDFKLVDNSSKTQYRAPLSGYFEVQIHIKENDFEKANKLLTTFFE